ncbi:MAG: class I SAM-dependent methyltransferase [Anaerolineae bacterium]|nr:class I SAM-dependent methyltransferase [Anaerolineae bacterium]
MDNDSVRVSFLDSAREQMKKDWNTRARQNSSWFINTISDRQTDREFDRSGRDEVKLLVEPDLPLLTAGRPARELRLLEIGCGSGRMTRRLSEIFGEVYATDVSGEMIHQARERLKDCKNVICQETNGADFASFDAQFFDVIFCAYVYQHVPSADLIRANLSDAFRVLRPGGVFKFQTNGVTNEDYDKQLKDTWSGDVFIEADIRSLAADLDAQMFRISGSGTQYCWTIWRRKDKQTFKPDGAPFMIKSLPVSKEILENTRYRRQSLLAAGLDVNSADINNVSVSVGETLIKPCYTGPDFNSPESAASVRIDFDIPVCIATGSWPLALQLLDGRFSPMFPFEVPPLPPLMPNIELITNEKDGGMDIESEGPKSQIRIFVRNITAWPSWQDIEVQIGRQYFKPGSISFVPGNGLYMLKVALVNVPAGNIPVYLVLGELRSKSSSLSVKGQTFMQSVRRVIDRLKKGLSSKEL